MSKSSGPLPPNTTLYVKNISNKIKKPELKRQLYCLFIAYGRIIDIVATKVNGMKGQAFIVFQDLASSTAALRALDGFLFYNKPLSVDYSKTQSKATIVAERGPEALFDPELLSSNTNSKKKKITFSSAGAELTGRERKRAREEGGVKVVNSDDSEEEEKDEEEEESKGEPQEKKPKLDNEDDQEEEEMQMANSDEED